MRLACRDEAGLTGSREMKSHLITLVLGIVAGLALGLASSYFVGQRYEVLSTGPRGCRVIKTDRWTGKSWESNVLQQSMTWKEIQIRSY